MAKDVQDAFDVRDTDLTRSLSPRLVKGMTETQTELVRKLAETDERYAFTDVLMRPGVLRRRLEKLRDLRLYTEPNPEAGIREVLKQSARIAVQLHGLAYKSEGGGRKATGRWLPLAEINDHNGRRGNTYLDKVLRKEKDAGDTRAVETLGDRETAKSMASSEEKDRAGGLARTPRCDMLLLANSYGLPLWALEVESEDLFDKLMEEEADARASDVAQKPLLMEMSARRFFLERAEKAAGLRVFVDINQAAREGHRAARLELGYPAEMPEGGSDPFGSGTRHRGAPVMRITEPEIASGDEFWNLMEIMDWGASDAVECLLFLIDDDGDAYLLSNHEATGGDVVHRGTFQNPRVPHRAWTLQPSQNSELLVVMADFASELPMTLERAACFAATKGLAEGEAPAVTEAQFADLRSRLLRRPKAGWEFYRLPLRVTAAAP